jgi:hypothetical protein
VVSPELPAITSGLLSVICYACNESCCRPIRKLIVARRPGEDRPTEFLEGRQATSLESGDVPKVAA